MRKSYLAGIVLAIGLTGCGREESSVTPDNGLTTPALDGAMATAGSEAGTAVALLQTAKGARSEEHTSELQSLMRNSYAVFCLKKKKQNEQMTQPDLRTNNKCQAKHIHSTQNRQNANSIRLNKINND